MFTWESWHLLVKRKNNTQKSPVECPYGQLHVDGSCVLCWLAGIMIGPAQSAGSVHMTASLSDAL